MIKNHQPGRYSNTPCQDILSIQPINAPYQYILLISPLYIPSLPPAWKVHQHTLSTHRITPTNTSSHNTPSHSLPITPTHPVKSPCQYKLSTCPIHTPSPTLLTSYQHTPSIHPITKPAHPTHSTHLINTPHTLSLDKPSQHTFSPNTLNTPLTSDMQGSCTCRTNPKILDIVYVLVATGYSISSSR